MSTRQLVNSLTCQLVNRKINCNDTLTKDKSTIFAPKIFTIMFENLSERLERSFKILKGEGRITEINVAETLKDVRRALLDADVNYKVAKSFTDRVKQKALGQNVLTSVKPGQLMVKIVHDELAELMGGHASELKLQSRPSVILMAGLNGAGKTTHSG